MHTVKESLLEPAGQLADDCTWEDVMDVIYVRQKIERGREDASAGRVKSHEEVFAQFEELD